MNSVIVMLLGFVTIGLYRERLGNLAHVLLGTLILVYVAYAYFNG